MDLQLKGTVEKVLDEKSGEGKNGPWRKRDFILKTSGDYPKQICITQWGDNIDKSDVKKGDEIVAHIDIQSREYQGNWYTDVKAWKIEKGSVSEREPSSMPGKNGKESKKTGASPSEEIFDVDDELPF